MTLKQVKDFNCALTSLIKIEETSINNKFKNYLGLINTNEVFASCGNDLFIEFFYLNNKSKLNTLIKIEKLNKFKLIIMVVKLIILFLSKILYSFAI